MLTRILATILLLICGCDQPKPSEAAALAEPWVALPHEQWPQLVLTNAAKFRGHSPLSGASGFLVRGEGGEILAATARHLLGENGGVEPEVTLAELDASFQSWVMYPRTMPDRAIKLLGSASRTDGPTNNDWVLLKVAAATTYAHALRLRRTPVSVGERVHLVGVSYAEPNVAQKVYSGVVTARGFGDRFRFDITPHVDIRGFSGAPVLDDAGLVVGVTGVRLNRE